MFNTETAAVIRTYDFFQEEDLILKSLFSVENEEVKKIIEILTSAGDVKNKIKEALFYQYKLKKDFYSLIELLSISKILTGINYSINDFEYLSKYKNLLSFVKHNSISFLGLEEYSVEEKLNLTQEEIKGFQKDLVIDPILFYKREKKLKYLLQMYNSSDIKKIKEKIKKTKVKSSKSFFKSYTKKNPNSTFLDWKEAKLDFLLKYELINERVAPAEIYAELEQLEQSHNFKYERDSLKKIKVLRQKSIYNERISYSELTNVASTLSKAQFIKALDFIWGGIKVEFNKLKRIKNKKVREERALCFYAKYRFSPNKERIWQLITRILIKTKNN